MNKFKELMDENKPVAILSILTIILFIIGLISIGSRKIINNTGEKKVLEEHSYTMYLKEEAIIKLVLRESYYKCGNNICSDYTDKISSFDLVNEQAKNLYGNINVKNKDFDEAISMILNEAKNKGHNIETLQLISNWKSRYNEEEFKELLKNEMGESPTYPIVFVYQETIDEQSIIANTTKKTFTITFDSNLGTPVDSQVITENELAVEPTPPTREGYDFVRWQFNSRSFSFDTPINKDYVLRASWKKKPTVSTIQPSKKTTRTTTTKKVEDTDPNPGTENPPQDNKPSEGDNNNTPPATEDDPKDPTTPDTGATEGNENQTN